MASPTVEPRSGGFPQSFQPVESEAGNYPSSLETDQEWAIDSPVTDNMALAVMSVSPKPQITVIKTKGAGFWPCQAVRRTLDNARTPAGLDLFYIVDAVRESRSRE